MNDAKAEGHSIDSEELDPSEGLRLMKAFVKIEHAQDRLRVITFAESLCAEARVMPDVN